MKKVGIILPCYNEEKVVANNLATIKSFCEKIKDYSFYMIPVNDGSKDNTKEVITNIKDVYAVTYDQNRGKGHATTEGIKKAIELDLDYAIFMDIDLSTDLKAIEPTLKELETSDIAIGSRYDKGAKILIKQPFKRRFISKCSRIIIKCMFHFPTKDTQCGFKGLNKKAMEKIIEKTLVDGFSFDVEYLYIAKLNGLSIKVVPVEWKDDRDSRVQAFSSSVRFFKDLFKIKRKKKHYAH